MTEKEIEEKACEFARNYPELSNYNSATSGFKNGFREGYQQGIKENGVVWHDLRKDPNDLPQETSMVLSQSGDKVKYHIYGGKGHWLSQEADDLSKYVIAWCEIPRFEEQEK